MTTADNIINKISGLIATANEATCENSSELTAAINNFVDSYEEFDGLIGDGTNSGGSIGGGGIIDVEVLPGSGYYGIECFVKMSAETNDYYTISQLIQDMGVTPNITYYVVDTLPTDAKVSDFVGVSEVHCYIQNDIPYLYGDAGSGNMWVTLVDLMATMELITTNKGFTDDITTETEDGLYVTYKSNNDPIDESAIYRITKAGSAEVFIVGQSGYNTFSKAFNDVKTEVYLVETLPATLLPCVTGLFRLYVLESTGFAYLDAGQGVMTVGQVLKSLDSSATDRGWTDDIASETKYGSYCVRTAPISTYYTHSNGVWDEYADKDVTDRERDEAVEKAIKAFVDYFAANMNKILIEIPEGVESIEHCIVEGSDWNNLRTIYFPKSLKKLNGRIVKNCGSLNTVIFRGTLETRTSIIFENCPKLADIYVPWAEGELGTGTWGAPDTVVFHYNADTTNM